MKRCPECNRVEADEALKFCRTRYYRGAFAIGFGISRRGQARRGISRTHEVSRINQERRKPLSDLAYGYAILGRRTEALAILKELQAKYARHEALGQDFAAVYAGLGDKAQAFAWLEKDFQAHSGNLARTRWYVPFESLRSDPRYADLLRRMGLKP